MSESGDRWFLSTVYVDLALAILAQGRHQDAAEVAERVETVPAPCDRQWVIKRHAVRALVASQRGEEAAAAAGRALALDQAKGNTVAAAATRQRFASLRGLGP